MRMHVLGLAQKEEKTPNPCASVIVNIGTVELQILVRQRQDIEIPECLSQIQLPYLLVGWQVNLCFEMFT